jgi:lysophospholipase L1-like esterase
MFTQPQSTPEPTTRPSPAPGAAAGLRCLALGDSYTAGDILAAGERLPAQLIRRLRAMGINIEDPRVIAKAGWTTAELSSAVNAANLNGIFDLITLLTGVANQYRGQPPDQYREQFRALLYQAIEFAGGEEKRVLVVSLPDWGLTPFAKNFNHSLISEQIDAYNQIIRAEASQAGTRYVDITAKSRLLVRQDSMLASDELHPSGQQYAAWLELIFPEALAALGRY